MERTEQWLIDLFKQIAKDEFNYIVDVPVSVNNRLFKYLGRIISIKENGNYKCIGFDFNNSLLFTEYPIESIKNTMRHELVHWYTDTQYNENCKHDERFIKNCCKFGVTDPTNFERYKKRKKLEHGKYHEAKCMGCDRVVAKCTNMTNLKKFMNRHGGTVCNCGTAKRYIIDKGVRISYYHANPYAPKEFQEQHWLDGDWVIEKLKIILCKE